MDEDKLGRYIRKKNREPTEITADDLSPPVCRWCGDELDADVEVVVWEVEIYKEDGFVRTRYCSKGCKKAHRRAIQNQEDFDVYGEEERIYDDEGSYE